MLILSESESKKQRIFWEKTDIPSGKIAGMIGYRDSNYFSLAFKKNTGYSPRAVQAALYSGS